MKATQAEIKENATIFQIFMIVLSIYVLAALFVSSMFDLSKEMDGYSSRSTTSSA